MNSRHVKPKPVEVVTDNDQWIWGNNRGGGGAPLRNEDGHQLANLRDVMKGNVQPDHSPTRNQISPVRGGGGRGKGEGSRYDDDYYDDRRRSQSPPTVRGLEGHYSDRRNNNSGATQKKLSEINITDREKEQKIRYYVADSLKINLMDFWFCFAYIFPC